MRRYRLPLHLEPLEDRLTPSTFGVPWLDPQHLTLSFVPDGTQAGTAPSNLAQSLNSQVPAGAWQLEILRAFQTWAVLGNVNIGLVPDGGQALGSAGLIEGDPRFGDLRVAGRPLSPELLASGSPFKLSGSTWGGDLLFNTQYPFGINPVGAYDLFTVALHEAGHAFGLDDEAGDTTSAMYQTYTGARTGPNLQDATDFQSLYGLRTPDAYEGGNGNNSPQSATNLDPNHLGLRADISTPNDEDYYRVQFSDQLPAAAAGLTVQVRTSGISLLVPAVTVYDSALNVVDSAAATSPLNGNLTVRVPNAIKGQNYIIRVSNATQSVFGIGAYQLSINGVAPPSPAVPLPGPNAAGHPNDPTTGARAIPPTTHSGTWLDYSYQASLSSPTDTDYYRVHAPKTTGKVAEQLLAVAWGTTPGGLAPRIDVFDNTGKPVAAQVVGNQNGYFGVSVSNVAPDQDYILEVSPLNPGGPQAQGNYFVAADFTTNQIATLTATAGATLTAGNPQLYQALTVNQSGSFQFVLNNTTAATAVPTQVQMLIYDASGHLVFSLAANTGQPAVSGVAYLTAGTYTVRYAAVTQDGSAAPALTFTLATDLLSDPIGPEAVNSTTPTTSPVFTWSDPSSTALGPVLSAGKLVWY
jgi:hypothetical protein